MKRIQKLICIVLSIAMLLILPVSAENVMYASLPYGDTTVSITYSTYGATGSTSASISGYVSVSTSAVFYDPNNPSGPKYSNSASASEYSTGCNVTVPITDANYAHYTIRSASSSHSYYATEAGYSTGNTDYSIALNDSIDDPIYFTSNSEYIYY
ncbi:MAG: hypothetical protein J6I45_01275 [Clostridia bacterium]|nr:hypothetical protein [Clostridia bacterium]